jgi:hypothetical protein
MQYEPIQRSPLRKDIDIFQNNETDTKAVHLSENDQTLRLTTMRTWLQQVVMTAHMLNLS